MPKYMTRSQLADYLRAEGYPIGNSTIEKLSMPSWNQGPPVARWWGRRPLYDPAEGLAWAEARTKPAIAGGTAKAGPGRRRASREQTAP